jgi:hypothetical protein
MIEIGGPLAGVDYDVLDVTNTAFLAGTLSIGLLGTYLPSAGASFDILLAEEISGGFDQLVPLGSASDYSWSLELLVDASDSQDVLRLIAGSKLAVQVPLPGTLGLLFAGLMIALRRPRRASSMRSQTM